MASVLSLGIGPSKASGGMPGLLPLNADSGRWSPSRVKRFSVSETGSVTDGAYLSRIPVFVGVKFSLQRLNPSSSL